MWLRRGAWTKETIEPRRQMGAWKVVHPCKEGRIGRHAWKRHHIDRSIVSISFGEAFTANQPELDVKAAGEFGLTSMSAPSTSSPSKIRRTAPNDPMKVIGVLWVLWQETLRSSTRARVRKRALHATVTTRAQRTHSCATSKVHHEGRGNSCLLHRNASVAPLLSR